MHRHSGSGSESPDVQPFGRLIGSLLGTHRVFSDVVGQRLQRQQQQQQQPVSDDPA
ncbi:hypothetical protein J3B02_006260, partial [Coemansia erecta]